MVRRFLNRAFGSSMRQLAEALRASELAALKAEIAGVIWLWVKIQDPKEPLQDEAMHQKKQQTTDTMEYLEDLSFSCFVSFYYYLCNMFLEEICSHKFIGEKNFANKRYRNGSLDLEQKSWKQMLSIENPNLE